MPDLSVPSLTETCRFLSDPALDGRYPGSEGHETARHYLEEMLVGLKFGPLFRDSWSQPVMDGSEIVGQNLGGIKQGKSGRSATRLFGLIAAEGGFLRTSDELRVYLKA